MKGREEKYPFSVVASICLLCLGVYFMPLISHIHTPNEKWRRRGGGRGVAGWVYTLCAVGPQSYEMEGSLLFRDGCTEVEMTKNQLTVWSPGVANSFLQFFCKGFLNWMKFFYNLDFGDQKSVVLLRLLISVTYKNIKILIRFSRQNRPKSRF